MTSKYIHGRTGVSALNKARKKHPNKTVRSVNWIETAGETKTGMRKYRIKFSAK